MNLLTARTTATSYPTDAALQKEFWMPGEPVGELVEIQLLASGTFGTDPIIGVEYSTDGGATWNSSVYTATSAEATLPFSIPNGCLIRPTFTTGGGTPSINLKTAP